jgi:hypothetical protein
LDEGLPLSAWRVVEVKEEVEENKEEEEDKKK